MNGSAPRLPDWSLALESMSDAVLMVDDAFHCIYANPAATDLLGLASAALLGTQLHELLGCVVHEGDTSCAIQAALDAGQKMHDTPGVIRHRDGRLLPVAASSAALVVEGEPVGAVLMFRDASRLTDLETERAKRAAHDQPIISVAPEPFFSVLPDGSVTSWNAAAEEMFGHTADQAVARNVFELLIPERQRDEARATICNLLGPVTDSTAHQRCVEMRALHRDGRELVVEITATTPHADGVGIAEVFMRGLTRERSAEGQPWEGVVRDALTGLPNRILLMDRLQESIRRVRESSRMVAVLFIDVDHFKVVNDSLGHDCGDDLLVAIGARLCASVRSADMVARFGGDEFVIVADEIEDVHQVVELAQRIGHAMAPTVQVGGRTVTSSVSIGIATATDAAATPRALLRDADAAMYRAKERGRNRFELFDDGMRRRAMDRLELEGELRHALDEGELRVFYQPIVDIESQQVIGFEALARWQHPTRGLLDPRYFIPLAEETGLISRLGEVILHEALRQFGQWRTELRRRGIERELTIAVNLSAPQVTDDSLLDVIAAALAQHGVPAEALCLEITESVLMGDFAQAHSALHRLRELGVRVAVDDFGTGYSSLLYLREFPVNFLKIDRFFVAGLAHSTIDRAIAASVVSLAHALDMIAVAEGVETGEQRAVLLELGCDLGQGFLWDRPLSAADATTSLGLRPARVAESSSPAPAAVMLDFTADLDVVDPVRIVLVDDNVAERSLLAHTLEDLPGFVVVGQASGGEEGIEVVARIQPDVLLLDLSMPGLDGVRALPLIADAAPDTRVVILSGYISDGVRRMAAAGGAVGCLDKNSGMDRLPLELLTLLRHAGAHTRVADHVPTRRTRDRRIAEESAS